MYTYGNNIVIFNSLCYTERIIRCVVEIGIYSFLQQTFQKIKNNVSC